MKETDLYKPVKELFEELGYEVYAEVKDMDVVAIKNDEKTIIELKTSFNLKLILQAIKRQKISQNVYIAIPMPEFKKRFSKDFKDKEYLLRRLELGLIFVSLKTKNPYAQIVLEPKLFDLNKSRTRNKRKKDIINKELSSRHGDNNIGGTKGKLVTSYREKALQIAALLSDNETMTTKEIREATDNKKATNILYKNYYGWFERLGRGVYKLNDKGHLEIDEYKDILKKIMGDK